MNGALAAPRSTLSYRRRVVAAAALIAAGFTVTERATSADQALHKRTVAGREVLLRGFAEFGADCKLKHVQTIRVVEPPAHGRVVQRPGEVTIGDNWVGDRSCAGTKLDGVRVYYVPDDGYVGRDSLAFDVEYASHRTVRATVDVTVDPAPASR